jgi:peptidoglycan/LPS O-acetylase OafA/YrhL
MEGKIKQSTNVTKSHRIPELDILRGFGILGVLVIHSSFDGRFSRETMAIQTIMARLFDWAVLAFFFSSGFLHDRSIPFYVTLRKRFLSLLVPFFIYNIFYNLCFFAIGALGEEQKGLLEVSLGSLGADLFRSPAFQLYFLPYLFLISVGISGLDKLCQGHYAWGYFAVFVSVAVYYLTQGYPQTSHGAAGRNLPMYLVMFLIGVVSRPHMEKAQSKPWLLLGGLIVMLSVLVIFRFYPASLFIPPLATAGAGTIQVIRQSKCLLYLGNISGSIYVWHTPLILPAITRLLAWGGTPSLVNLFGSITLTLAICIILRAGLDSVFVQWVKSPTPKYITL